MAFKYLMFLGFLVIAVNGADWGRAAVLKGNTDYFAHVVQEMINDVEEMGWCNLKLPDIVNQINDTYYAFKIVGNVTYTNGFVVSIQKMDLTDIRATFPTVVVDGEEMPFVNIRGTLNLRDVMVGFDMVANLAEHGMQRSTGTFLHTLVAIQLELSRNLVTRNMTSSPSASNVSGVTRMIYMPSNNFTEALGRRVTHNTFDAARTWGQTIFAPILVDIATNRVKFPEICFNNCS